MTGKIPVPIAIIAVVAALALCVFVIYHSSHSEGGASGDVAGIASQVKNALPNAPALPAGADPTKGATMGGAKK